MHRKRVRLIILSFALVIVLSSIASFSSQNLSFELSKAKYSGTNQGSFSLKDSAHNIVKWNFVSTRPVDLLIIKEVTLEYFEKLQTLFGITMDKSEYYVSRGKLSDSGETPAETPETLIVKFVTYGEITYSVSFDPVIIELNVILYLSLGILLFIGLINVLLQLRKRITHVPDVIVKSAPAKNINNIPQENGKTISLEKPEPKNAKYCDNCGSKVDLDAIFCHECGYPLKLFCS